MRAVFRRGADPLDLVEALYAPLSSSAWLSTVLATARRLVTGDGDGAMFVVEHADDFASPGLADYTSTFRSAGTWHDMIGSLSPGLFRLLFYPGLPASTHSELERLSPADAPLLAQIRAMERIPEALACFAYPEPGVVFTLALELPRAHILNASERRVFARWSGHLDSAVRMRNDPELAIAAVLAPDGRLLDLNDASLDTRRREWFAHRIALVDRFRRKRQRSVLDVDNPWWPLFQGRYAVVPREDRDGKRYYLLVQNSPRIEPHARFAANEIEVVRLAARGLTSKSIAYSLGVSQGGVSNTLGAAALKLGLRSRNELVQVAAAMFGVRSDTITHVSLTATEREILTLLQRGLSNVEIARRRKRSPNTIKNQVAAMLRKTRAPSRRALSLLKT